MVAGCRGGRFSFVAITTVRTARQGIGHPIVIECRCQNRVTYHHSYGGAGPRGFPAAQFLLLDPYKKSHQYTDGMEVGRGYIRRGEPVQSTLF